MISVTAEQLLLIILYLLGSILLVVLIILGIKLINTVTKADRVLDELEVKIKNLDKMFSVVDVVTDSMAVVSDKIVDAIVYWIKRIFGTKKGKEEDYE